LEGSPLAKGREANNVRAVVMAMAGKPNHRRAGSPAAPLLAISEFLASNFWGFAANRGVLRGTC
jgi:hypothetical protein